MMRRILIGVWAVVAAAAAAGVIWFYAAGDVGDPTEVTAPAITTPDSDPPPVTTVSTLPPEQPEVVEPSDNDSPSDQREDEPVAFSPVELELSSGTQARFLIFEELRGEPFTVVGVTEQVVGRVRVDRTDLASSQLGEILINARTFTTDSSNRDRAIRGPILDAEHHEFITFSPTAVVGLSGAAESEGEWSFVVEGDLTVRDVTRPLVFEVTARWEEGETGPLLAGEAVTTVSRSDFGLNVPSVPFVANVADEIGLELVFVAQGVG